MLVVKPCPKTLSPKTPKAQPQPSPNKILNQKGLGLTLKCSWPPTHHPPPNPQLLSMNLNYIILTYTFKKIKI